MSGPVRVHELDPAWGCMPADQIDRVLGQDICDIGPEFLGFTDIYIALASVIPKHWTIVDLGCAYAPQAILFKDHKAYIGVDISDRERFSSENTTHYCLSTSEFIERHGQHMDMDRTFAICSYVPDWHRESSRELARAHFKNLFSFYPATDPKARLPFSRPSPSEGSR